eukprot:CAMPEP_0176049666 /NCGR_PEP_ID=MMETSP0120_2-20121206/24680_1 /TAXON_ID=160619 /ORGANISM="Kryptoperidinium foliaceum, Strain CCMP 1326" /LENGTH=445 /DNA_ID=CAMNT_0017383093 /DNA_START=65 /DNA_END=1402 /DNA_ORIENTATION=-
MTGSVISTSVQAFEFAKKLVDEYEGRKRREKEMNLKKEAKKKKEEEDSKSGEGPSRTVTQIDYGKHERTVKELDRQEEEEKFQRKKEEAAQWCTLDHEHGPNCRRPIGGCSHDHQKEWAIYEKSTEEKIKAADRFREEGNEAYRKHNYGLAAVHYRKALLQFDYTFAEGEEEEKQVEAVKVPCLLNLAACKCQQEQWDEVLTHCRLALEINPRSVKAYYRIGLAHLARDNFEEAKDALLSAHEIEPKNAEVLGALKRLKENMENYKVRRKEVFKEMVTATTHADGEVGDACDVGDAANVADVADAAKTAAADRSEEPASVAVAGEAEAAAPHAVDAAASDGVVQERGAPSEASGVAAASAAPPTADATPNEEAAATTSSGLRRRLPQQEGMETREEDEDVDAEEALSPAQRRLLNRLLIGAVALGLTSVVVCVAASLLALSDGTA